MAALVRSPESPVTPQIGHNEVPLQLEVQGIPGLFDILPDGSVLRSEFVAPPVAPTHTFDPPTSADSLSGCSSRDVVIDAHTGVQVRLFLPEFSLISASLLPVIVYVHGGGFCMMSAKTIYVHNFCIQMATVASALVVSVEYRLAPEHRLPAAYDDIETVLGWLARHNVKSDCSFPGCSEYSRQDPWISSYADLNNMFLMGENSGANALHHVLLRRRAGTEKLLPINGLIQVHPFFGGEERTASEIKFAKEDSVAPTDLLEEFWKVCLPVGASRDHPFCNPFHKEVADLSDVEFPRTLVVVGGRNSLLDRQVEYFKLLKKFNKDARLLFLKNAKHAFELLPGQSDQARILLEFIVMFMSASDDVKLCRSSSKLVT